ncbi:hypothetical protein UJ101_00656 [Flavobacteriaceae bacterium UJ101]|nr:hypothetical protein UJ101_00656 [Flavobacteriaceae bacterium UJ101]
MKNYLKRKYRYEFWPFWLFYAPFVPVWLYYSIKSRSFTYFTNSNPGIENGGFIQYSKYNIIKQISTQFLPKTVFIKKEQLFTIKESHLPSPFPLIVKPDFGERGKGVFLVHNLETLFQVFKASPEDYIIQEYIDYPIELGVFYYHFPENKDYGITGITTKDFLIFYGDGKTSLQDFILQNIRAYGRKDYLLKKYSQQLHTILPKGEQMLLEPIGNHNRGTTFLDQSELITPKLIDLFHTISKEIEGFHYGRFDLKVQSLEDLRKGHFKIFEVNGANSEATHIYDPIKYNLFSAYSEVLKHLKIQYKIAKQNKKNGFHYQNPKDFFYQLTSHFK